MIDTSGRGRGEIVTGAGAQTLSLLAVPFNVTAIRALAEGPRSLTDLRLEAGSPPQTTMRGYLRGLAELGVIERRKREAFAATAHYSLTASGRDLLELTQTLAGWLARSPQGPIELGTIQAKNAIKALTEGWSTGVVRALAGRPLSLTELDRVIDCLSYPSLERRLSALRLHKLVEAVPSEGRSTPYVASDWLRNAIGPLAAAARWERGHRSEHSPPIAYRDVEAAFLLVLPLLRMDDDLCGFCRLMVRMDNGEISRVVGVVAEVRNGVVVSCVTRLDASPDARVVGSPTAWFSAVIEGGAEGLETGGEPRLAAGLVEGLHDALFGASAPEPLIDKYR